MRSRTGEPPGPASVPRRVKWAWFCCLLASGCVQESSDVEIVTLPEEAVRFERYLELGGEVRADVVRVWALRAYRKDCVPLADTSAHVREVTPDLVRLEVVGGGRPPPARVMLRNLRFSARRTIEVRFSDRPLLTGGESPLLLHVEAEGAASFRGPGIDLAGDRIEIRNDRATAVSRDGRVLGSDGG